MEKLQSRAADILSLRPSMAPRAWQWNAYCVSLVTYPSYAASPPPEVVQDLHRHESTLFQLDGWAPHWLASVLGPAFNQRVAPGMRLWRPA